MSDQKIESSKTATVLFVRGIPGSGKTTIAEYIKEASLSGAVVLDPDLIDYNGEDYQNHTKEQAKQGVDPKLFAYRYLRAQAYDAITDGKLVIWNQPFSNLEIFNKITARLTEHARSVKKKVNFLIVEVEVDPQLAYQRVQKRKSEGGHGPSQDRFDQFVDDYQTFAEEGYEVEVVDGNSSNQAADQILAKLKSLKYI